MTTPRSKRKTDKPSDNLPIARGYTRDAGYVRLWRELFTCYGRRLGLDAIALWAFLRDHVNRANGLAWPGYRLIQSTFDLSRRQTLTALIHLLEAAGLIEAFPACQAIPDARDRRSFGINDRATVYLVHDPPTRAEFVLLTRGRECAICPFLEKCQSSTHYLEGGGNKTPPPSIQGGASPGGGGVLPPPVVAERHHNKINTIVVAATDSSQDLVERMTALQVARKQQLRLLKEHSREYLLQKLGMVERKLADGSISNPPGWFVRACQEDWLPPPESLAPKRQGGKRKNAQADIKPPKSTRHYY